MMRSAGAFILLKRTSTAEIVGAHGFGVNAYLEAVNAAT